MFKLVYHDLPVKFWLQKDVFYVFCQVWKIHWAISLYQGLQVCWYMLQSHGSSAHQPVGFFQL